MIVRRLLLKYKFSVKLSITIILLILTSILCFWKLEKPAIEIWDEYLYYNVVYSTIDSDNFLILQDGRETFFEKPPLWFWLAMFSTKIFGINNFSIRLVSAVSGFSIILLTFYLGQKMFSYKAGLISGFTLLATRQLFFKSPTIFSTHNFRSADLDALQLLFIMLSTLAFFNLTRSSHKKYKLFWLIIAAIFSGFAFLTKGPFALLPGITYFLFRIINHKKMGWKSIVKEFLIFHFSLLIITVPWHIFMIVNFDKEFISDYFGYHILKRGLTALEGHNEDILFYVKLLFHKDFFFSGEIFLLAIIYLSTKYLLIRLPIRQSLKLQRIGQIRITNDFALFHCFIASLFILLIITLIQTRLSWYILPLYPFAALLIGKLLHDTSYERNKLLKIIIPGTILFLLSIQITSNLVYLQKL